MLTQRYESSFLMKNHHIEMLTTVPNLACLQQYKKLLLPMPAFRRSFLHPHTHGYGRVPVLADAKLFGQRTKCVNRIAEWLYAEALLAVLRVTPSHPLWEYAEPCLGSTDAVEGGSKNMTFADVVRRTKRIGASDHSLQSVLGGSSPFSQSE